MFKRFTKEKRKDFRKKKVFKAKVYLPFIPFTNSIKIINYTRKMKNSLIKIFALCLLISLFYVGSVSASRIIDNVTLNEESSVTIAAESSVTANVTVILIDGDVWKGTGYRIGNGDWKCSNTHNNLDAGTYAESFTIDAPSDVGVYDVEFRASSKEGCGEPYSNYILTDGITVADKEIQSATLNDVSSVTAVAEDSVTTTVTVTLIDGDAWKGTGYQIGDENWECFNHPAGHDYSGTGTYTESFTISAPSDVGVYDVKFRASSDNSGCSKPYGSNYTLADGLTVINKKIQSAMINGASSISVPADTLITASLTVQTGGGSGDDKDWESTKYQIEGQTAICENTPNHVASGTNIESFSITTPSSLGTYDINFWAYSDNNCSSGESNINTLADGINVVNTIASNKDSYIKQDSGGNDNYGTDASLYVRASSANNVRRTYIGFDLSPYSSHTDVSSANVYLYLDNAPSNSRIHNIYKVTSSWTETEITWNTQPSASEIFSSSTETGTSKYFWISWDVTSDVQSFLSGTTNNGWVIKDSDESSSGSTLFEYVSKEESGATDPYLAITYLCDSGWSGTYCNQTICGDGIIAGDEVCDDSNANDGDGCSATCQTESIYYYDSDNDGYGDNTITIKAVSPPQGYVSDDTDCDDNNAAISPIAIESCDGIDNNCNSQVDEDVKTTFYQDTDDDGYYSDSIQACESPGERYTTETNGLDNCPDVTNEDQSDVDSDGIGDACDTLTGNSEDVSTNKEGGLSVEVNGSTGLGSFSGEEQVRIVDGSNTIVEFDWDFDDSVLDLSGITVNTDESAGIGSVQINGLLLPAGITKTVYVNKLTSSNSVCIKDVDNALVTEISSGCNGADEVQLPCPGTTTTATNTYTCMVESDGRYKITGLTHSAVKEYTITQTTTVSSGSSDTSGSSGGGSHCEYDCTSWGDCINDKQTRTCTPNIYCDENSNNKALTERSCTTTKETMPVETKITETTPIESEQGSQPIQETAEQGGNTFTGRVITGISAGLGAHPWLAGLLATVMIGCLGILAYVRFRKP